MQTKPQTIAAPVHSRQLEFQIVLAKDMAPWLIPDRIARKKAEGVVIQVPRCQFALLNRLEPDFNQPASRAAYLKTLALRGELQLEFLLQVFQHVRNRFGEIQEPFDQGGGRANLPDEGLIT